MEWQPIETAPKDGTSVLLCRRDQMQVASFGESSVFGKKQWVYGEIWDDYNTRAEFDDPTHWMPLPEPPTAPQSPFSRALDTQSVRAREMLDMVATAPPTPPEG